MCLSRFLDDIIENEEYYEKSVIKREITHSRSKEKDTLTLNKKGAHLKGVVPFEISKAKTNESVSIINN